MDYYSWNGAYYQLVFDFPRPAPQAKSWLSKKECGNTFSRTRARSCSSSLGRRLRSKVSYSITKSEPGFVGVDVWLNVNNAIQERNREVGWPVPLYEHSYPYPVHRPQDGFRPSHWKLDTYRRRIRTLVFREWHLSHARRTRFRTSGDRGSTTISGRWREDIGDAENRDSGLIPVLCTLYSQLTHVLNLSVEGTSHMICTDFGDDVSRYCPTVDHAVNDTCDPFTSCCTELPDK
jgi:hypothetical protein